MSVALGIGFVAQSLFVGGNVAISSIMVPILRQPYVSNSTRAKQFALLYDRGAALMGSSAVVSLLSNAWLYFNGPQNYAANFLVSSVASFSAFPITAFVVYPTVKALKQIVADGNDEHLSSEYVKKWNYSSIFRTVAFSVGYVSTLQIILSSF